VYAPYNWWGSDNSSKIDSNILDYLDNNGAGWVNYTPFWKDANMTTLSWTSTKTNITFTNLISGSMIPEWNVTVNYSMILVGAGEWSINGIWNVSLDPAVNSHTFRWLTRGNHTICADVLGVGQMTDKTCVTVRVLGPGPPPVPVVNIIGPANGTHINATEVLVSFSASEVVTGEWRLNNGTFFPFNISRGWIQVRNLSYGANWICLTVFGAANQNATACVNVFRITPPLEIHIISPISGAALNVDEVEIIYLTRNATRASWKVAGVFVDSAPVGSHARLFANLNWGQTEFCLVAEGPNNQNGSSCIYINRPIPLIDFHITSPLYGSEHYYQDIQLMYAPGNTTAGNWSIDGVDLGPIDLGMPMKSFYSLSWGLHNICASLQGIMGQTSLECVVVRLVPPPLSLEITSPMNGSSVDGDRVVITFLSANSTNGEMHVNGLASILNLSIGQQEARDLAFGANEVCLHVSGKGGQNLSECIMVLGRMLDTDQDTIPDLLDFCNGTDLNWVADDNGCALEELDLDHDLVFDAWDTCKNTSITEVANLTGCGPSQRDSDGDGFNDLVDDCPSTVHAEYSSLNATGCGPSQRDVDRDGVSDKDDLCPDTAFAVVVEANGCKVGEAPVLNADDSNDTVNETINNSTVDATTTDDENPQNSNLASGSSPSSSIRWAPIIGGIGLVFCAGILIALLLRGDQSVEDAMSQHNLMGDQLISSSHQNQVAAPMIASPHSQQHATETTYAGGYGQAAAAFGGPSLQPSTSSLGPTANLRGQMNSDGYEYLEWPSQSGTWYYRDQGTGEWVIWQ